MKIVNKIFDDIIELTQMEGLLSSFNTPSKRNLLKEYIKEIFKVEISIFESAKEVSVSFRKNKIIDDVLSNYTNNEYYDVNNLKRDFTLSTQIHVNTKYDGNGVVNLHLDKEYYVKKYNIKDIEVNNMMSEEYFKYKYGSNLQNYPIIIREYVKRIRRIENTVKKYKDLIDKYNVDNVVNVIFIKKSIEHLIISKQDCLLFDIATNISDDGIMKLSIKPTWQFKKMNRKINKLFKPPVNINNYGVSIKFKNCTPLLSKSFMQSIQEIINNFNREKTDKWVIKESHVELIGRIFKVIEKENSIHTDNNLKIKYHLDFTNLNMLEINARYFTVVGQELTIVDKYYEKVTNYRMYESPTIEGLLLRNRKGDFEDAMYMLSRYNRTNNISYILDRGILIPLRADNNLYEGYVRDRLSQHIDFLCNKQSLYKEQPSSNDLKIEFDDCSWINKQPKLIITLQ